MRVIDPSGTRDGYALVATLVTMVIISSAAAAILTMSMAAYRRGAIEVEWARQESALEASIVWASNELAAAPELRAKEHFVDKAMATLHFNGYAMNVVVRSEEAKLDINEADPVLIETILTNIVTPAEAPNIQSKLDEVSITPLRLLDDLWLGTSFSQNTKACLRNRFTVFNGQIEGAGYAPPTPIGRNVTAGRVFDLMAYINDSDQRGARVTILITGDEGDPYWTMDWRWIATKKMEDCDVDEI